jgi:hypothetical protein
MNNDELVKIEQNVSIEIANKITNNTYILDKSSFNDINISLSTKSFVETNNNEKTILCTLVLQKDNIHPISDEYIDKIIHELNRELCLQIKEFCELNKTKNINIAFSSVCDKTFTESVVRGKICFPFVLMSNEVIYVFSAISHDCKNIESYIYMSFSIYNMD